MAYRAEVSDPRDPLSEHVLQVRYHAKPGTAPIFNDIYGGDPGYGPEYDIVEVITKRGTEARLTSAQLSTLVDRVHSQHEW